MCIKAKQRLVLLQYFFNLCPHHGIARVLLFICTHNRESQQQAVCVAATMASIFIRNLCVVISLVFFLLLVVCVGLVGCRLVCHPVCEDSGKGGF